MQLPLQFQITDEELLKLGFAIFVVVYWVLSASIKTKQQVSAP
jgi:hypothetical protein